MKTPFMLYAAGFVTLATCANALKHLIRSGGGWLPLAAVAAKDVVLIAVIIYLLRGYRCSDQHQRKSLFESIMIVMLLSFLVDTAIILMRG